MTLGSLFDVCGPVFFSEILDIYIAEKVSHDIENGNETDIFSLRLHEKKTEEGK